MRIINKKTPVCKVPGVVIILCEIESIFEFISNNPAYSLTGYNAR